MKEADLGIKCFELLIPSRAQCSQYKYKPLLILYVWVFLLGMLQKAAILYIYLLCLLLYVSKWHSTLKHRIYAWSAAQQQEYSCVGALAVHKKEAFGEVLTE